MRTMKGSIYRYARKQAYREFSRAYRGYQNSSHHTQTKNNSNSDSSFEALICVFGFIVMMLFISWITN